MRALCPEKEMSPNANCVQTQSGGRRWIRTTEAEKQQIYSLPPLATREFSHIQLNAPTKNGAGGRTRTPDLLITNQLLYQLSYTSIVGCMVFYHIKHNLSTLNLKKWSG